MDTLQFQLRVHRLSQTHELSENICKHYFGAESKYNVTSQANLAPDDAEQAIFTVNVWAELIEFVPDPEVES